MGRPATKKRVKEARNAMYRELIIEAAERVFADQGFEATRVQAVAREAGISLATLYGVFPGKFELYSAIQEERTSELMALVAEAIEPGLDPIDLLLAGIEAYLRFHMDHVDYLRMHLREGHLWTTESSLRVTAQGTAWQNGIELGTAAFKAAIDQGLMVQDDPLLLFRTVVAMHQVRLADWVEKDMEASSDEVMAAIRNQFVRAFCTPEVIAKRLGKPH